MYGLTVLPSFKYEPFRFNGFEYELKYYMVGVAVRFTYDHTVLTCFKYEHRATSVTNASVIQQYAYG